MRSNVSSTAPYVWNCRQQRRSAPCMSSGPARLIVRTSTEHLSVVVVIPTYNELENLGATVSHALDVEGIPPLIVDDESPGGTGGLGDSLSAHDGARASGFHR